MRATKERKFFPEVAHLSEADRKRLWRQACRKAFLKWQTLYALLACGLMGGILGWAIQESMALTILAGAALFVQGGVFHIVFVQMAREWLRETQQKGSPEGTSQAT